MTMRFLPHTAGLGVLLCLLGTAGGAQGQETKGYCPDGATWSAGPQNCPATWTTKTKAYWKHLLDETIEEQISTDKCGPGTTPPGLSQSPINLIAPTVSNPTLGPIAFNYAANPDPSSRELANTGHSVQLSLSAPARSIVTGGQTFNLAQMHFHYPSEHIWNGERFALELHLVHAIDAAATKRAVVAVLIKPGQANTALDALFGQMTSPINMTDMEAKAAAPKSVPVNSAQLTAILPANRTYVTYGGSLTTPTAKPPNKGCEENVTWLVLTTPIEASQAQIDKFKGAISYTNAPFQVNARPWLSSANRSVSLWSSTASTVNFTTRPNPTTRNVNLGKGPGAEPIAEAAGWRLRNAGSYLDFQFTLAQVPPNGMKLTMRHISSTIWPAAGYSPINITMLNKNPPIKTNYDVTASAGGSRDYQQQTFTIPPGQLQQGQNTLRVALQPGARTHYWIEWLVIE